MNQSEYADWLKSNESLRMDAHNTVFKESRRRFHLSRYEFAGRQAAGLRVLDAACGTGYGSALLAESAVRVDGVDQCRETIAWATHNYGRSNTCFHAAYVEFTPFPDSTFDLVVSFETLEHTLSPTTTLWEFVRVMKPGGCGIFSVPNGWGLTENHFVDFNQSLLERVLGRCFGEFRLYYNNSGTRKNKTAGIAPLEDLPQGIAECLVAVCHQPRKADLPADLRDFWTAEIYQNAFRRHREYLALRKSIPRILRGFLLKD